MKRYEQIYAVIFVIMVALLAGGCHSHMAGNYQSSPYAKFEELELNTILHVPTGTHLSEDELMDYVSSSRVVYVGETHKNTVHHDIQLRVLMALEKRYPGKVSVGMEMLRTNSQEDIDKWLTGELSEAEFFKLYLRDWGYDIKLYQQIFDFIKENKIPLVALNAPRRSYSHEESSPSNDDEEAEEAVIPDIDDSDPYHKAMLKAVIGDPSHGHMTFDDFYMAQLIWEETMADTAADYLKSDKGKDKRMVVIAGGGHISHGYGIPKRLFRRLPEPYTTILPISVDLLVDKGAAKEKGAKLMDVDMPDFPLYISDFVWATNYEALKDKPPMLGVFLKDVKGEVVIVKTMAESAAEEAGIMEGDSIVALDDELVTETFDIKFFLSKKENGDKITVTVKRAGVELKMPLTLKPMPEHNHLVGPLKPGIKEKP